VKSSDVYAILRDVLGPWCKESGLLRTKGGMLGWYEQISKGSFLTFWFQVSRDGWDDFAGSKFIAEFQRGSDSRIGTGTLRHRLCHFLGREELATVQSIQNDVIRKLVKPLSTEHVVYTLPQSLIDAYEARFDEVRTPFRPIDDVWLRYVERGDVERWGRFLLPLLPRIVETMSSDS
jgi:hypothetical protein